MSKTVLANHNVNTAIIVVLVVLFISVIYIPKSIWDDEADLRDESRFRMHTTNLAEKLHYMLVNSYTTDTDQLVTIVNGVRDSILAAMNDTNYTFLGERMIPMPPKSFAVNYTEEYEAYYNQLHRDLFKRLQPNHYMKPELVTQLLDSIKVLFDAGGYEGEQSMELDSISLSFVVSDKYDILYQNIKTYMFNALTNSFTKYPNFSNPLVDAVMDSLKKNPELTGRTDFEGIYDGEVRVDFFIPTAFEENLEKTKLALKKHLMVDSYDSSVYGDTLYNLALEDFFAQLDTLEEMPTDLTVYMPDTTDEDVEIYIPINTAEMKIALDKRRNTLYKMLSGYDEPSPYVAEMVINMALDSLSSSSVGMDSMFLNIDLSNETFNINVHRNVREYYSKVSLEQAYYKTAVNLTDLDWDRAAVEIVEFVADRLKKKSDFLKWQVVEGVTDTFNVNIPEDFLRRYDDMNMKLFSKLTDEFSNRHDLVYNVVSEAQRLASIDTLDFSGKQTIEFPADTILVNVADNFLAEYDTTFIIPRDTVIQIMDSTFHGVYYRFQLGVTEEFDRDSLGFLVASDNSKLYYDFNGADSVRSLNVLEKGDSSRVEKVFSGLYTYVMIFDQDSLVENVYLITDEYAADDSIQIDSLSVVSDDFIAGMQEKDIYESRDSFGVWTDTIVSQKYDKIQLYRHYLLTPEHTHCSVTGLPFRITVRNNVNLAIESPITKPIEKRRYLFFTQLDSSHGGIDDGEFSWAE